MKLGKKLRVYGGAGTLSLVGMLLAGERCPAQLPVTCKAPAKIDSAMRSAPTASLYDAAGAWFAERHNLSCALAAFGKAVQIDPASAEAHYNLGLAHVGLKHSAEAEKQFLLALKYAPAMTVAHTSLGLLYLDAGRAADAEAEFRSVLKTDGDSVAALDNLGMALAAERRYSAAIGYWQQALSLKPDSPEILLSIAAATYKDGDAKKAMTMLTSLLKSHPDMKDAHFTLGNIYAHDMRFGDAAAEYSEVVRLDSKDDVALLAVAKAMSSAGAYEGSAAPAEEYVRRRPGDPEGHLVLGSIYKTLAQYDKAEKQLTLAAAAQPQNAQAQYELGFVLAKNQKDKAALPHLEKAYALNPSDTSTQFQLARVLRKLGDNKRAAEITDAFQVNKGKERELSQLTVNGGQANAYLKSGEPARAAEVYRQMLTLEPGNAHTEYNLALALAAMHDVKGEREALEKAAELDPKMALAQSELGLLDIAGGDLDSARRRLEAALAIDPQLAAAQGNLGLIHALKGDSATAEKMFRQAIEDDPNYVQGHLNLGLMLASRQNFPAAEAELEHALTLAPNDPRVVSVLGKVRSRLGKSDQAISLLRKSVELSPHSVEAHVDLAIALADSYDLQGALAEADKAIQMGPQSSSAQFNHGRILFDLGRPAEARASLETACRLAPNAPDPHYYLALVHKQLGDFSAAARLLETVVQLQPGNVMAWNFLAQSLHEQSKDKDAVGAWRRALSIDPEYTPALWGLSRTLMRTDRAEAERFTAQLNDVLKKRHVLDEAETVANRAIASMQAHDWPEAVTGLKSAIQICGECSHKPDLHKSLGLIYCHAGDLDNGERELRLAESLKAGDADVLRALAMIARAREQHGGVPGPVSGRSGIETSSDIQITANAGTPRPREQMILEQKILEQIIQEQNLQAIGTLEQ